jgi:hypothetical protein
MPELGTPKNMVASALPRLLPCARFRLTREAEEAFFAALVGAAMCPAF